MKESKTTQTCERTCASHGGYKCDCWNRERAMKDTYKMQEQIFIVMEKIGLDPVKNVRSHYALEQVLKSAWNAALDEAELTLSNARINLKTLRRKK